ncbi:acyltransferase [Rhodococcoides trifolii]|uniref:Acyltransferase n=1 Tax=Rhodococcoides trifolii TaxID=908250 RepID=A0A917G8J9_9NOCA|nr:acyltransferase [Rhodococcus trifolii]
MHAKANNRARNGRFRPDIQGLRAVAVILVVLDHLWQWPAGGFIGVDVFFVISGFLITGLLLKEGSGTGSVSIANFYRRRARRILPASLLVLAITATASYLLLLTDRAQGVLTDTWWSLAFLVNWHLAAVGTNYFESSQPPSPLQHYWSLAVEEQFYVVWPLVIAVTLLVLAKLRSRMSLNALIFGLGTAVIVVSFAWAVFQTHSSPTNAYFSTFSRAWELAVGAVVAAAAPLLLRMGTTVRNALAVLGLAGIVVSAVMISSDMAFPAPVGAAPVVAAALLLASGVGSGSVAASWPLTLTPVVYIGSISFSLYLWHWPVIVLMDAVMARGVEFYVVAIVLMAVLSVASYHFVEQAVLQSTFLTPAEHRPREGRRRRRRRMFRLRRPRFHRGTFLPGRDTQFVVLAAVSVLFVCLAIVALNPKVDSTAPVATLAAPTANQKDPLAAAVADALKSKTYPPLNPSFENITADRAPEMDPAAGCLNPVDFSDPNQCVYGPADAPNTAMVVADSISISWMPGLRASLEPRGYRLHGVGGSGCPFADVDIALPDNPENSARCNEGRARIYRQINETKPSLVIVSGTVIAFQSLASGNKDEQAQAEWQAGNERALAEIAPSGARVVFLAPNPPGPSPTGCITRVSAPSDCVMDIPKDWQLKVLAEKAAAASSGATFVDTSSWFCDAGVCPIFAAGAPIRWDEQHLTATYSRLLAPYLERAILG